MFEPKVKNTGRIKNPPTYADIGGLKGNANKSRGGGKVPSVTPPGKGK